MGTSESGCCIAIRSTLKRLVSGNEEGAGSGIMIMDDYG
jgi:hypothetical protein